MTATSLTDRYVAAAMRTVPEKQRDDLGTELRASIDDQIDARVENGEPHGGRRARSARPSSATRTSSPRATPIGRSTSSDPATTSTGGDCSSCCC